MIKVYIAGKVTGENAGICFAKFAAAEYQLKQNGFEVINPMRLCNTDTPWHKCMRVCLREMLDCEAVYLLPDWNNSVGATIELVVAAVTAIPVIKTIYELKKLL